MQILLKSVLVLLVVFTDVKAHGKDNTGKYQNEHACSNEKFTERIKNIEKDLKKIRDCEGVMFRMKCYTYHHEVPERSQDDANKYCVQQGGRLASIDNKYLYGLIARYLLDMTITPHKDRDYMIWIDGKYQRGKIKMTNTAHQLWWKDVWFPTYPNDSERAKEHTRMMIAIYKEKDKLSVGFANNTPNTYAHILCQK